MVHAAVRDAKRKLEERRETLREVKLEEMGWNGDDRGGQPHPGLTMVEEMERLVLSGSLMVKALGNL